MKSLTYVCIVGSMALFGTAASATDRGVGKEGFNQSTSTDVSAQRRWHRYGPRWRHYGYAPGWRYRAYRPYYGSYGYYGGGPYYGRPYYGGPSISFGFGGYR